MENLKINPTKYSPEIYFDCEKGVLDIKGDSYPENTEEFYAPVFSKLQEYLRQFGEQAFILNVELTYFNSGSSRVLAEIFDMLAEASSARHIIINWIYDEEDEGALEWGEDFEEEYAESLNFNLVPKTSD